MTPSRSIRSIVTIIIALTFFPTTQLLCDHQVAAGPADEIAHSSSRTIDRPTGNGPYNVGYTYDNVTTSYKNYSTVVKIFYPAIEAGHNTTADLTNDPYPTVLWLPGACCGPEHYTDILIGMASWGIVVMTVGINWLDWEHSGNVSDIEDLLDYLELLNGSASSILYKIIDKEAFGLTGHSAGGGLAVVDAPFVDRIKAVEPLGAAISDSTVDVIAPSWHKPVLCQVGLKDTDYLNGCRRVYDKFPAPNSKIELIGGDHFGPFKDYLLVAFFLYYLDGMLNYWPYLYGEEAVNDVIAGDYDLWFKTSSTHFFPPIVHAKVPILPVTMDQPVFFEGSIDGYYLPDHPENLYTWDFEGDGSDDFENATYMSPIYTYIEPGNVTPVFTYRLGRFHSESIEHLAFDVANPPPVADAGVGQDVIEDQPVQFNGNQSFDTISDTDTMEFNWTFGDGAPTGYSSNPQASHIYKRSGTYDAVLYVRDRHGAVSTDNVRVVVRNLDPTAEAGTNVTVQEDSLVLFHGVTTDTISDWPGLRFRWEFGDDSNLTDWSNVTDAEHVYKAMGNYTATFFVRDSDDAFASDDLKVMVSNVVPSADIAISDGLTQFDEDQMILFHGIGQDTPTDQAALNYRWKFGDGNETRWSPDPETRHSYPTEGFYTVTLYVKDNNEAVAFRDVTVEIINLAPTAKIIAPSTELHIMEDDSVRFIGEGNDTPSDVTGLVMSWEIEGRRYSGAEAYHVFTSKGTYQAIFKVIDPDGVLTISTVRVDVYGLAPTVNASVAPQSVLVGQSLNYWLTVDDTPTDLKTMQVLWEFDDGAQSTEANGTHAYWITGTYTVKVTVRDNDNEKDTKSFTITVLNPYTPPPPPEKMDEGMNPAPIEALLVVLTVAGVALLAFTLSGAGQTEPAPVRRSAKSPGAKPMAKKGSKKMKKKGKKK